MKHRHDKGRWTGGEGKASMLLGRQHQPAATPPAGVGTMAVGMRTAARHP